MSYVAPSAPLSVGGILDDWLRLFRGSFGRCWPLALLAAVAAMTTQLLVAPRPPRPGLSVLQYLEQTVSGLHTPAVIAADLLFWLIILVVYGALLAQQSAVMRGDEPLSLAGSLASAGRRLPQMLLGGILFALILAAVVLLAGAGVAWLYGRLGAHAHAEIPSLSVISAVIFGVLALVIAAAYLSVRLEFWLPAIFAEGCGGAAALGRSWRLVKGHWWHVTAVTFVASIIIWILSLAIGGTAGLIVGVFGAHGLGAADILYRVRLGAGIATIARVVTMPLLTAVWLAIYHDLRLRFEGADLAARAQALGGR